jgi:hypothetical protein
VLAVACVTRRRWLLAPALVLLLPILINVQDLAALTAIPRLLAGQADEPTGRHGTQP